MDQSPVRMIGLHGYNIYLKFEWIQTNHRLVTQNMFVQDSAAFFYEMCNRYLFFRRTDTVPTKPINDTAASPKPTFKPWGKNTSSI